MGRQLRAFLALPPTETPREAPQMPQEALNLIRRWYGHSDLTDDQYDDLVRDTRAVLLCENCLAGDHEFCSEPAESRERRDDGSWEVVRCCDQRVAL